MIAAFSQLHKNVEQPSALGFASSVDYIYILDEDFCIPDIQIVLVVIGKSIWTLWLLSLTILFAFCLNLQISLFLFWGANSFQHHFLNAWVKMALKPKMYVVFNGMFTLRYFNYTIEWIYNLQNVTLKPIFHPLPNCWH